MTPQKGPGVVPLLQGSLLFLRVVWLASALPLDYHGKLRILRTMYIPAALHGVEASHLSQVVF